MNSGNNNRINSNVKNFRSGFVPGKESLVKKFKEGKIKFSAESVRISEKSALVKVKSSIISILL